MSSAAVARSGELAAAYAMQVPVGGERRLPEDFERQLMWLKLEAEIEGKQRERFYAERRELVRKPDLRRYTHSLLESVIGTYLRRYRSPKVLPLALFRLYESQLSADDLSQPGVEENSEEYDAGLRVRLYEDIQTAYTVREHSLGSDGMRRLERRVIISVLDKGWCLHLAKLDAIFRLACSRPGREFISIYRSQAQESYSALLDYISENVVGYLFHLEDTT